MKAVRFYGPRERLLERGASSVSEAELLEVVLGAGPGAPRLLELFGGLEGVLAASAEELATVSGMGPSKQARLIAIAEMVKRWWGDCTEPPFRVLTSQDAYRVFSDLASESQEVVSAAFLDVRNRVIRTLPVFRGTLESSTARPREILREALRANAARLVVAHNHPSQEVEPSDEDVLFTVQLEWAAGALGIPLLDHLIVARKGKYFSFAEAKLLTQPPPALGKSPALRSRCDPDPSS